jgi:seryl-tRNA synthetase
VIDLRLLREDPDAVRASQRARGDSEAAVDTLLAADEARRAAVARFEALRSEQKQLGKRMPKASGDERVALLAQTKDLAAQVKEAEAAVTVAAAELRSAHGHRERRRGRPARWRDDYRVVREVGEHPAIESPRDHLELLEQLVR